MTHTIAKLLITGLALTTLSTSAFAQSNTLQQRQHILQYTHGVHANNDSSKTLEQARTDRVSSHTTTHDVIGQDAVVQQQNTYNSAQGSVASFQTEYSQQALEGYAAENPAVFIGHPTLDSSDGIYTGIRGGAVPGRVYTQ